MMIECIAVPVRIDVGYLGCGLISRQRHNRMRGRGRHVLALVEPACLGSVGTFIPPVSSK